MIERENEEGQRERKKERIESNEIERYIWREENKKRWRERMRKEREYEKKERKEKRDVQ